MVQPYIERLQSALAGPATPRPFLRTPASARQKWIASEGKPTQCLMRQKRSSSAVLNFGYGRGHSVREVTAAVKQPSGVDFAIRVGKRRAGDPARLVAANYRLKAAFGRQPCGTGLDAITRSALAWEQRLLQTAP